MWLLKKKKKTLLEAKYTNIKVYIVIYFVFVQLLPNWLMFGKTETETAWPESGCVLTEMWQRGLLCSGGYD